MMLRLPIINKWQKLFTYLLKLFKSVQVKSVYKSFYIYFQASIQTSFCWTGPAWLNIANK